VVNRSTSTRQQVSINAKYTKYGNKKFVCRHTLARAGSRERKLRLSYPHSTCLNECHSKQIQHPTKQVEKRN
jgi:hypothetical protein